MAQRAAKRRNPVVRFVSEVTSELRKVVWLSRREVAYLTFLVILIASAVGALLGVFDFAFARLINDIFVGL